MTEPAMRALLEGFYAQQILDEEAASSDLRVHSLSPDDERRFEQLLPRYLDCRIITQPPAAAVHHEPRWAGLIVVLAAAAMLVLMLREPMARSGPLRVHYEVELRRDLAVMRKPGDRSDRATFRVDRMLEAWVRPVERVSHAVDVAVFGRRRHQIHPLSIEPQIEGNGSIHILEGVRAMGLKEGAWDLIFVVGWLGELSPTADGLSLDPDVDKTPYDVVVIPVRIVEP